MSTSDTEPRVCVYNKFPGDAAAAGPGTTLGEPLGGRMLSVPGSICQQIQVVGCRKQVIPTAYSGSRRGGVQTPPALGAT